MPANLPPHYYEAEKRYREGRTTKAKIAALEEMFAIMPKHKGTDKLRADLRRRMARVREEGQKKVGGKKGLSFMVEQEGAAQLALVGLPNTGKSLLLATLSKAKPQVGEYPFTTRTPLPGMVPYENIQFQFVDLPPVSEEFMEPWMGDLIRRADLVLLLLDLSQDPLDQFKRTKGLLEGFKVYPVAPDSGGEGASRQNMKPTLILANKADLNGAGDTFALFQEYLSLPLPCFSVSALAKTGLEELKAAIYKALGILRVYTKAPGKEADLTSPYVVKERTTVYEFAGLIHKEIQQTLKYARIWGRKVFDGQMVQRDYVLNEGDIIELHSTKAG